jgi:hypothetical protein
MNRIQWTSDYYFAATKICDLSFLTCVPDKFFERFIYVQAYI